MGVRLAFDCEICHVERRDVNRWFEFYDNGEGAIGIRHFKGNELLKHVCGQACAHKLLDRWLSTGSLEEPERDITAVGEVDPYAGRTRILGPVIDRLVDLSVEKLACYCETDREECPIHSTAPPEGYNGE